MSVFFIILLWITAGMIGMGINYHILAEERNTPDLGDTFAMVFFGSILGLAVLIFVAVVLAFRKYFAAQQG